MSCEARLIRSAVKLQASQQQVKCSTESSGCRSAIVRYARHLRPVVYSTPTTCYLCCFPLYSWKRRDWSFGIFWWGSQPGTQVFTEYSLVRCHFLRVLVMALGFLLQERKHLWQQLSQYVGSDVMSLLSIPTWLMVRNGLIDLVDKVLSLMWRMHLACLRSSC